jgi:Family of unknown function (DUF5362)
MENFDQPLDVGMAPANDNGLAITHEVRQYWRQTSAWALFFAILLFILFGLVSLSGLIAAVAGGISGIVSAIFIVVFYGAILFFPGLYYYRFSIQLKQALTIDDTDLLDRAFNNLKYYYRYVGILMIIVLTLYLVFFLFFGAAILRGGAFPTEQY